MIYVKSFLVGIGAALVTSTIWILTRFVLPLVVPFLFSRATGTGSGGVSVVFLNSGEILGVALIGFAVGFWWQLRRVRVRR